MRAIFGTPNCPRINAAFKEMSTIKETFEKLESVISFAVGSEKTNRDTTETMFHFAAAKTTFSMINNSNG